MTRNIAVLAAGLYASAMFGCTELNPIDGKNVEVLDVKPRYARGEISTGSEIGKDVTIKGIERPIYFPNSVYVSVKKGKRVNISYDPKLLWGVSMSYHR